MSELILLRWLHLLGAITWIGGMIFVALVLVPALRPLPPSERMRLFHSVGVRFRNVGWAALALLILTGIVNLSRYPFFLKSPVFLLKLGFVAVALVLSFVHDFIIGPRLTRLNPASPSLRLLVSWLARVNLLIALAIVLLGLSLAAHP